MGFALLRDGPLVALVKIYSKKPYRFHQFRLCVPLCSPKIYPTKGNWDLFNLGICRLMFFYNVPNSLIPQFLQAWMAMRFSFIAPGVFHYYAEIYNLTHLLKFDSWLQIRSKALAMAIAWISLNCLVFFLVNLIMLIFFKIHNYPWQPGISVKKPNLAQIEPNTNSGQGIDPFCSDGFVGSTIISKILS